MISGCRSNLNGLCTNSGPASTTVPTTILRPGIPPRVSAQLHDNGLQPRYVSVGGVPMYGMAGCVR